MRLTIIVVGDTPGAWASLGIPVITMQPRPGITLQALRAAGVAQALTPLVAIVDSNYVPTAGWLAEVLKAETEVTAGCIAPSSTLTWLGWAIFLGEYLHLAPPLPDGTIEPKFVPGGNVVYQRDRIPLETMRSSEWELDFHEKLRAEGRTLIRNSRLIAQFVGHQGWLGYCRERWDLSHTIARTQRGTAPRWWLAVSRTALPALLMWRMSRDVLRRPAYFGHFIVTLPLILFFALVQASGEVHEHLTSRVS